MNNAFRYKIDGNKLIIEACPNGKITGSLIHKLLKDKDSLINELIICEGIEEIEDSCFFSWNNVVKVTFPNSLKRIGKEAFGWNIKLKEVLFPNNTNNSMEIGEYAFYRCQSLENLNIPNGVARIHYGAFSFCKSLQNVYLSDSLMELESHVFDSCYNLKTVKLPSSLEVIRNATFKSCKNLENIILPEGLKQIKEATFRGCFSLKSVSFPSSLTKVGEKAFCECQNIKSIDFNEGLEEICPSAFSHCKELEEVVLPSTLKYIREKAFMSCGKLKKVVMNDGVTKLGDSVFYHCTRLEDITLSNNIKEIPFNAFYECFNLKKIILPDSVEVLHKDIFYGCKELKKVVLSKNIKKISTDTFNGCDGLERIVIPEGIEEIEERAFVCCSLLKEVYLPKNLKKFYPYAFEYCSSLRYLYLKNKNDIVKLDMRNGRRVFVRNSHNLLFTHCSDDNMCGFYKDGEYIEFNENTLLNNDRIRQLIDENHYDRGMYINLYYYSKKKFIPSNIVIENMPLDDIDKFYINNNGREWAKLIKSSVNVTSDENKASFFKLCYVLGVFSESTSVRDRAIKFLNEKIVNVLDADDIHSRFDGFDLNNGFNEEYAEFFMKYYNNTNFMIFTDEYGDKIDLMAASYNNFNKVKKVYPNKTIHTNREADLLLPEHVMNAVRSVEYSGVNDGNVEFALTVGRYGYTQEQFKILQDWYNKGKQIKEMKLFVSEDKEEKGITYNLLSKNDPLNAILGNITNCCQVIAGAGQSCVEYGMTMPNSGFITFNYKGKIIGQAWVWYDEESKTICLDNIEIPHRYLEKIHQNKTIQNSFVECLLRIEKSFKEEMNKRRLEVDKVTIGEGYNDINEILDVNFILIKSFRGLSDYSGYSDAYRQYEIKKSKSIAKK